jgi:hypothetical protein
MKRAQQAGDEWARIFALQIMVGMHGACAFLQAMSQHAGMQTRQLVLRTRRVQVEASKQQWHHIQQ